MIKISLLSSSFSSNFMKNCRGDKLNKTPILTFVFK